MATGRAIVKKALDQLKLTLSPDDARYFADTTLQDLWKEARRIEYEQAQRLDMRCMRQIEGFLRTVESYSGVIEVFCQGFSPMAFVWGPIKLILLDTGRRVTSPSMLVFGVIMLTRGPIAYSAIGDVLPRLDKLKAAFGDTADFQQILGLIYSDILEFHQRAYKMFRRKKWHVWFAFGWGLFERRFKSILSQLSNHCDLLDKEAAATHFLQMKCMREKRQLEEKSHEDQMNNQLTRETLGWLSADEDIQEEFLHRLADQRQLGTCDWILTEPEINIWIEDNDSNPTVWMTGIPGAGKSFLCSLIVQNSKIRQDCSVIYYFCGQKPGDQNASSSLLRTMAVQLLTQNLELAPLIHQAFLQKGSGRSSPTIKKILKEIMTSVKTVRMVLDGIDEWDQAAQQDTLKTLAELQKHGGDNCKVLVSSRKEPWIRRSFPHKIHMQIGNRSVEGLNCYVNSNTEDLRKLFPEFAPSIFERLKQNLQANARGMFLWVRLVKKMLEACSSEDEFEKAIEQLPDGLNEAYGRILSRLNDLEPARKERALKVLYWTCIAYRSVNIHEVVDGIALRPGQTQLCAKNRSQNPERDILDLCAPLLEKIGNGKLELVHFSAKEYLVDSQSGPYIDVIEAHFHIAFSCIVNLTSALVLVPSFSESLTETDIEKFVVAGSYGLHDYAHQYWAEHLTAHLRCIPDLETRSLKLIEALNDLSTVLKGYSTGNADSFSLQQPVLSIHELQKLRGFPKLVQLVSVWMHFKARLTEMASTFETLDAQETYMLQNDQTYFSLVSRRLREVTERLLKMDQCALPPHIEAKDFTVFAERFDRFCFSCRVHGCSHTFSSTQERDSHEISHKTTFPCLQCDFTGRGFRSKDALRKHTQKYHMSPEDFEVPKSLDLFYNDPTLASFGRPGPSSRCARISQSWTEQGREAARRSFRQILDTIESKLLTSVDVAVQQNLSSSGSNARPTATRALGFETIRGAINEQRYNNLRDFKDAVQNLLSNTLTSKSSTVLDEVDTICDEKLENVNEEFSAFANIDKNVLKLPCGFGPSQQNVHEIKDQNKAGLGHKGVEEPSPPQGKHKTYWSFAEKEELPKLLDRYGRNLIKIAACLKTKTLEEIGLRLEEIDLRPPPYLGSEMASSPMLDRRIEEHPPSNPLAIQPTNDNSFLPYATLNSSQNEPPQLAADREVWSPLDNRQPTRMLDATVDVNPERLSKPYDTIVTQVAKDQSGRRQNKTPRRPRGRRECQRCGKKFDEYGVDRHVKRYHTATRIMWVCKDVSVNRTFLSHCAACPKDKLYATRYSAMKHLRDIHFTNAAKEETLLRWLEPVEEPNPNYVDADSQLTETDPFKSGVSNGTRALSAGRARKRRRLGPVAPLRQLQETGSKSSQLPPIRSILSGATKASREGTPDSTAADSDTDSNDSDVDLLQEIDLFPTVSFDNLLPVGDSSSSSNADDTVAFPNKFCIRKSQVHRLPHLNEGKRRICLDQVEALYNMLDLHTEDPTSDEYMLAEKELTSLSRTLLAGLRKWRQQEIRAPSLPFSI
ncbi:MAG: hypothetical protein Q9201_005424 [Fulgogasparrea decipioides]